MKFIPLCTECIFLVHNTANEKKKPNNNKIGEFMFCVYTDGGQNKNSNQ